MAGPCIGRDLRINPKKGFSMSMTSLINILKVGVLQDKKWEGREYQVQEAECLLLDQDQQFQGVGVLRLSEEFRKNPPAVGIYQASFALVASPKDRRIGAQVIGLVPVPAGALKRSAPAAA